MVERGLLEMAKSSENDKKIKRQNKQNRNISGNINAIIDQLQSMTFGSTQNDDVEQLNTQFNDILKGEMDSYNRAGGDTTSFISNIFKDSQDRVNGTASFVTQLNNIFEDSGNEGSIRSFIDAAYKNRLLKQSDLHEVTSQLIELREAVLITRDAIISSDIVEGKMTRSLKFDNTGLNNLDELISTTESMERKFKLQDKIKNFIVPKTLEYGEYYAYVIPYSKIFSDFMARKEKIKRGINAYTETTLYDFIEHENKKETNAFYENMNAIFESVYEEKPEPGIISKLDVDKNNKEKKKEFDESVNQILKNITICNDPVPLTILEQGVNSTGYFMENFIEKDGINFNEKEMRVDNIGSDSYFYQVVKSKNGDGTYTTGTDSEEKEARRKDEFKQFHDCYLQMIDPTKLLPIPIMTKRLGYYYIQVEETSTTAGVINNSLYYNRFDDSRRESTIVDAIATKIVQSFDKKFLEENSKFKDIIVEALNYYNLNNQRIRFQFIPQEYIVAFKVSEDENGNGTSIVEPSLFYAKLYLMLLLFNMMSIILYSNDQRINYVKNSGIDKNVRKKIEEIARNKQMRQINVMDMFSYTSLINKLGVGAETYIPVGKSGERGLETEVIQGQDIQLHNDLMDNLKKSYILGTGVPDAIMNYANEADFAKSLEMANTRFMGRVVSYQYDFNDGITDLYQRLMRWSTNLSEDSIDSFEFSFAPPKNGNAQIKADMLQNFDTYANWVIGLLVGQQNVDNPDYQTQVKEMKILLAKDALPMINFDKILNMFKEAKIDGLEELLLPNGSEEEEDDPDLAGL